MVGGRHMLIVSVEWVLVLILLVVLESLVCESGLVLLLIATSARPGDYLVLRTLATLILIILLPASTLAPTSIIASATPTEFWIFSSSTSRSSTPAIASPIVVRGWSTASIIEASAFIILFDFLF